MGEKEKHDLGITVYAAVLVALAVPVILWAFYTFPVGNIGSGMLAVLVATILFGSSLRVELPGTNIHLSASDTMVFFVLLTYGGEAAVILGASEAAFSSYLMRRKGVRMRGKTIVINAAASAISIASTWLAIWYFFGPVNTVLANADATRLIVVIALAGLSLFVTNSIIVSIYFSIKNELSLAKVWNEYCFNTMVICLSSAILGGLLTRALDQVSPIVVVLVATFFAIVYFTFVRYAKAVKESSAKAETAERERAEQAETHISELEHYIKQLEMSTSALRESHERLHHTVFHDALTGLPNRNYFVDHINNLFERRASAGEEFAIIFLDLNRFKTINDSLGYLIGDEMIKTVAKRLDSSGVSTCSVGRFGGDEFAVVMTGIRSDGDAIAMAEWICSKVAEPYELLGRNVFATASLGIAVSDDRYSNAEEILRDADIAMHNAKESGKSYVVFDQIMHARAVSLLELETDLRMAVERKEFELFYQPIVNLGDASLIGFEALIRWNHPSRGLVTPGEFIETAESTGLIIPMTFQVLQSACSQLARWKRARLASRSLMMSVNLSASHLSQPDLVERLVEIIDETGVDPSCLKLEITESAVMGNAEAAIEVLRKIQWLGIQLSIDDFGTGYSNLSYLHRFPIDTLKVDRSFVNTMEDGTENGEIVRTVIALAKALRLSVIAEGIESIHQFHQLRILGCEFGQGYLFSRPLPSDEATRVLEDPGRWAHILPNNDVGVIARNLEYTHLRIQ